MKIIQSYRNWCRMWTRSQLFFLFVMAAIPIAIAFYASVRFVKARNAAYYWQEKAIEHLITSK